MPSVDLTIRLGDILTMVGLFGGGIAVVAYMRADMKVLVQRVGGVESKFDDFRGTVDTFKTAVDQKLNGITNILVEQAKHDERLGAVERAIADLRQMLTTVRRKA